MEEHSPVTDVITLAVTVVDGHDDALEPYHGRDGGLLFKDGLGVIIRLPPADNGEEDHQTIKINRDVGVALGIGTEEDVRVLYIPLDRCPRSELQVDGNKISNHRIVTDHGGNTADPMGEGEAFLVNQRIPGTESALVEKAQSRGFATGPQAEATHQLSAGLPSVLFVPNEGRRPKLEPEVDPEAYFEVTRPKGLSLVHGYQDLKRTLFSFASQALYPGFGMMTPAQTDPPRGLMLSGTSGVGKTLFAQCIAPAMGAPQVYFDMGLLKSRNESVETLLDGLYEAIREAQAAGRRNLPDPAGADADDGRPPARAGAGGLAHTPSQGPARGGGRKNRKGKSGGQAQQQPPQGQRQRRPTKRSPPSATLVVVLDNIDDAIRSPDHGGDPVNAFISRYIQRNVFDFLEGCPRLNFLVVATAERTQSLDPHLLRGGRFSTIRQVPLPDRNSRLAILQNMLDTSAMGARSGLKKLADESQGYTAADLRLLAHETAMVMAARGTMMLDAEVAEKGLEKVSIPSHMRGFVAESYNIDPEQAIFGDTKRFNALKTELEGMLDERKRAAFAAANVTPTKGVLFEGPPGTGKTLFARALASALKVRVISIKAGDLLSKWYGESEENVRSAFANARQAAPCILFCDEFDSIGTSRERRMGGGEASEASNRVVNQFLTEMDGFDSKSDGIVVIAATNHASALDRALMRPGRFDRIESFVLPNREERQAALEGNFGKLNIVEKEVPSGAEEATEGFTYAEITGLVQSYAKRRILFKDGEDARESWKKALAQAQSRRTGEPVAAAGADDEEAGDGGAAAGAGAGASAGGDF